MAYIPRTVFPPQNNQQIKELEALTKGLIDVTAIVLCTVIQVLVSRLFSFDGKMVLAQMVSICCGHSVESFGLFEFLIVFFTADNKSHPYIDMKSCSVSVFIVKIVPQQTRWVPCVWWVLVLFCWSRFLQLGGAKGSVNRGCQNPYIIASDSELPPGFDQHIVDYFTNSDWSNKNSLLLADDFGLVHPQQFSFS